MAASRPTGCSPEAISRSRSCEGLAAVAGRRGVERVPDPARPALRRPSRRRPRGDLPLLADVDGQLLDLGDEQPDLRPDQLDEQLGGRGMELHGRAGAGQPGRATRAAPARRASCSRWPGPSCRRPWRASCSTATSSRPGSGRPGVGWPSASPSSSLRWAVTNGSASSTITTRRLTRKRQGPQLVEHVGKGRPVSRKPGDGQVIGLARPAGRGRAPRSTPGAGTHRRRARRRTRPSAAWAGCLRSSNACIGAGPPGGRTSGVTPPL